MRHGGKTTFIPSSRRLNGSPPNLNNNPPTLSMAKRGLLNKTPHAAVQKRAIMGGQVVVFVQVVDGVANVDV